MARDSQAGSAPADAASAPRRVVLFASPDVMSTIGRPGLLEARVGADVIDRLPSCRSDVLLQRLQGTRPPETLTIPSAIESEVCPAALDGDVGVVVFSILPELLGTVPWRHRPSGWLIEPPEDFESRWPEDAIEWLRLHFEPLSVAAPSDSVEWIRRVASILIERDRAVFIFNVSTYDPADHTHRYAGVADTFELRAQRVVAGLERLAAELGVNVVDVDGSVAEVGARENVPAPGQLSDAAAEFVTDEAILAIDQSGALRGTLQAPVMALPVPPFDRRTLDGAISRWHVAPGSRVSMGDPLFEVRFDKRAHRFDRLEEIERRNRPRRETGPRGRKAQVITVSVTAGSEAVIHAVLLPAGSKVSVGDVAGIMTTEPATDAALDEVGGDFRVGAQVVADRESNGV